jgi:hypothetical protein
VRTPTPTDAARGRHSLGGGSECRGCKVGDRGALGVEGIALLSGQRLGDPDHHHARQTLGLHLVVDLDDLAVDFIVSVFCLAKMQLAQAPTFAVGEGDLRDVEDDPVTAHVLKSSFELHHPDPFGVKEAILCNGRIGFNHFVLLD